MFDSRSSQSDSGQVEEPDLVRKFIISSAPARMLGGRQRSWALTKSMTVYFYLCPPAAGLSLLLPYFHVPTFPCFIFYIFLLLKNDTFEFFTMKFRK